MRINRNKTVQRLSLHISFSLFDLPLFILFMLFFVVERLISILWFRKNEYLRYSNVFVYTRSYRNYLFVEFDQRFLLGKFLQSDWKERVWMRPAVTLPAHGVVCASVLLMLSNFFGFYASFSFSIIYCSFSTVVPCHSFFLHFSFPFSYQIACSLQLHLNIYPYFVVFILFSLHLSLYLPPAFRCTMIYCTSERRANSYLIKKNCRTKKYVDASVIS